MKMLTTLFAALLFTMTAAFAQNNQQGATQEDIVAVASGNPDFSTLVEALKAADLVETLQGDGPFTVFAPTNEAFEALPDGTLEELLKPENKDQLKKVLTYHVLAKKVMAADLQDGMAASTVEGDDAKVMKEGDSFVIEGATITKPDIMASNGVIHVIDAVMLPSDMKNTATSK